jgi:hypothetical protein
VDGFAGEALFQFSQDFGLGDLPNSHHWCQSQHAF